MIAGALKAKCHANHRESRPYSRIWFPEVLRFEDIVVGEPGDDEALIRNTVIGLTSSPFGVLTPMSQPDSLHLAQCNFVLCPVV